MELYIGGCSQGKLNYVLKKTGISEEMVLDAVEITGRNIKREVLIINHFHLLVKNILKDGRNPEDTIKELSEENPELIIICDEVGNGIVPVEAAEREYRERLGRILCGLAEKAVKVERIICGIGQIIK
ncbi:bifunctional adenosylcobinamide kinase/adenosylcobinamide-phosphate guanylyltransferase [Anaerocolumna chitinilytica]|uniref:Adenosylcobinamide kinase n=1 Tax=Anaerocolumna chitinilytica TaxID=1727145 RepID=A0A7I8DL66_9FIRM|nr:bifunctional adenosylcobinamide kinase/adenosylcobinamide-phosphate guanylyltransferase [Anaerocolumna chitinilytica]BCJ99183.1 hypothetical protein bsdcttw_22240 [Anaerocolumna chitinilytica]